MSTVLKAGNATTGGSFTPDSTGILEIKTGTSSGTTAITIDASQNVSTTNGINVPNTFGFKNRLFNAGFGIWQRGTSFTVAGSTYTYTADRWLTYSVNSSTTISRNTSVPTGQGFPYSAQVQRTAANAGTNAVFFEQVIESNNMLDLAGQTVALSFWAKAGANFSSNSTGVFINTGTVADQGSALSLGSWTGYTSATTYTFTPTTTWTKYTATATLSSSALELAVLFFFNPVGTAGADDSLYITGVQLEKGTQATSFDYLDYGRSLIQCQRYFLMLGGNATNDNIASGQAFTTTTSGFSLRFPTTMRGIPTLDTFTASNWSVMNGSGSLIAATAISLGGGQTSLYGCQLSVTVAAGLTAGQGSQILANTSNARLPLNAEL